MLLLLIRNLEKCVAIICSNKVSSSVWKSTANQKLLAFSKYIYDGLGQRLRFRQFGRYDNKTYHLDVLLLFRRVMAAQQ